MSAGHKLYSNNYCLDIAPYVYGEMGHKIFFEKEITYDLKVMSTYNDILYHFLDVPWHKTILNWLYIQHK